MRLSVHMAQLGSHWTDFHEIWYVSIFRKCAMKIQVSLKSDNNNGTLHEDQYTFFITSRSNLLRIKTFQTKVVEKIKVQTSCSMPFSRKLCRVWDNVEKYGRADARDKTLRRMRISCLITKKTKTHSEYVTLSAHCTATMVAWTRLNVKFIRKKILNIQQCFDFLDRIPWNTFHSKINWLRYDPTCISVCV